MVIAQSMVTIPVMTTTGELGATIVVNKTYTPLKSFVMTSMGLCNRNTAYYKPFEKGISMKIRLNGSPAVKQGTFTDLKPGNVFQADYEGDLRTFVKMNGNASSAVRLTNGEMVVFSPSHPATKRKDFVLSKI